ncbi:MAG: phosphatase PAP2 family protein [Myxococcota bacterium]|nr:phosphatase PAP2 family protein [Myxococcota bacterium]
MWIFSYGIAAAVGTFRVVAGAHFLSDVIVGAITGVGLGLAIPWLHELPRRPDHLQQAAVQLRPYFSGVSAGLIGRFN